MAANSEGRTEGQHKTGTVPRFLYQGKESGFYRAKLAHSSGVVQRGKQYALLCLKLCRGDDVR